MSKIIILTNAHWNQQQPLELANLIQRLSAHIVNMDQVQPTLNSCIKADLEQYKQSFADSTMIPEVKIGEKLKDFTTTLQYFLMEKYAAYGSAEKNMLVVVLKLKAGKEFNSKNIINFADIEACYIYHKSDCKNFDAQNLPLPKAILRAKPVNKPSKSSRQTVSTLYQKCEVINEPEKILTHFNNAAEQTAIIAKSATEKLDYLDKFNEVLAKVPVSRVITEHYYSKLNTAKYKTYQDWLASYQANYNNLPKKITQCYSLEEWLALALSKNNLQYQPEVEVYKNLYSVLMHIVREEKILQSHYAAVLTYCYDEVIKILRQNKKPFTRQGLIEYISEYKAMFECLHNSLPQQEKQDMAILMARGLTYPQMLLDCLNITQSAGFDEFKSLLMKDAWPGDQQFQQYAHNIDYYAFKKQVEEYRNDLIDVKDYYAGLSQSYSTQLETANKIITGYALPYTDSLVRQANNTDSTVSIIRQADKLQANKLGKTIADAYTAFADSEKDLIIKIAADQSTAFALVKQHKAYYQQQEEIELRKKSFFGNISLFSKDEKPLPKPATNQLVYIGNVDLQPAGNEVSLKN